MSGKIDLRFLNSQAGAPQPHEIQPVEEGFHCVTCADEALEARVLEIDLENGLAQVQMGEAAAEIDLSLLEGVAAGDRVLVHGGVALARL